MSAYAVPTLLAHTCPAPRGSGPGGRLRVVTSCGCSNRALLVLLLVTFAWRVTSAGYYTFYTIYITDMGASASLVSIAWALGLVGEVTVLRLSNRIAGRVGIIGLLAMGLLGSALRWLAYALAPGALWPFPSSCCTG